MTWSTNDHITHLQKLLDPGVIGNYNSFEVTEILGFHHDSPKQAINFLSLLVAEPSSPPNGLPTQLPFLTNKLIGLRGTLWKFGATRYRVSITQVLKTLQCFSATGEWKLSTQPLKVGALTPLPPQFVPADTGEPHPWNGVLKNNFWEGSHILELFDVSKLDVKFLLDEPKLLKQLVEKLMNLVKISIDGMSDRLGSVLIQLPVTVVTTKVSCSSQGDFLVHPIWHHGTPARKLRVSCEKYEDTTVEGYGSKDVSGSQAIFPIYSPGGGARYVVWDDAHQLVLGASAQTAFITSIDMSINIVGEKIGTREFCIPLPNGALESIFVPLIEERVPKIIGSSISNPCEPWRENRVFRDGLRRIHERKEFIQYGGNSSAGMGDALKDIRALLRMHGKTGAWLWDPYLDAQDVLATLFYCPHKGADLRALTAGAKPPATIDKKHYSKVATFFQKAEKWLHSHSFAGWVGLKSESARPPKQLWQDKQLETFKNLKGNCKDLRLEFRIRKGSAGWAFHDRFLIFPSDTGPAKAWSLGTSINSFGRDHHILQQVADGELIKLAFLELWDQLSGSNYLVWSTR